MSRKLLLALAFVAGCSDSPAEGALEGDSSADTAIEPGDTDTADSAVPDTDAAEEETVTPDALDGATSETAVADAADTAVLDAADTAVADSADGAVADSADSAGCPAPTVGELHVAPTGDDATGNGSASCPFKTIGAAVTAVSSATVATTILVETGTYGEACTGGAPCDTLPIYVPATVTKGLVIRGTAAASVRVVGGTGSTDSAVFRVLAPDVGFENLTVAPRRLKGAFEGAWGIDFKAAAAATEASVKNVVIDGVVKTSTTEATGVGISVAGGTSPTLGPGLTVKGGSIGVQVWQGAGASKPTITSSVAAPTLISDTTTACVSVNGSSAAMPVPSVVLTSTSTADPGRVHLRDCGTTGIQISTSVAGPASSIARTRIDSTTSGMNYGIVVQSAAVVATGEAVRITSLASTAMNGFGIGVSGTATFTAAAGLVIDQNQVGIRISGSAKATLDGVVANDNGAAITQPGLYCTDAAQVKIRNSTFLGNAGNGVWAEGTCALDLGAVGSPGNNVFQRTSHKNARVGLCYLSTVAATATSSTWSCGLAATAACTPSTATTPKPVTPFSCLDVGTFDYFTTTALTVPATPQTCCGL
jgi:hypothetical protein